MMKALDTPPVPQIYESNSCQPVPPLSFTRNCVRGLAGLYVTLMRRTVVRWLRSHG